MRGKYIMSQNMNVEADLEKELEKIEEEIDTHNRIVENLVWRRSELLTQKQDLEICELIDCIIEKGLTTNEVLLIVNSVDDIRRKLIRS